MSWQPVNQLPPLFVGLQRFEVQVKLNRAFEQEPVVMFIMAKCEDNVVEFFATPEQEILYWRAA